MDILSGAAATTSATFTVSCTGTANRTVTLCVEISPGQTNAQGNRRLAAGTYRLVHELYSDSAHTTVWGSWGLSSTAYSSGGVGFNLSLGGGGSASHQFTVHGLRASLGKPENDGRNRLLLVDDIDGAFGRISIQHRRKLPHRHDSGDLQRIKLVGDDQCRLQHLHHQYRFRLVRRNDCVRHHDDRLIGRSMRRRHAVFHRAEQRIACKWQPATHAGRERPVSQLRFISGLVLHPALDDDDIDNELHQRNKYLLPRNRDRLVVASNDLRQSARANSNCHRRLFRHGRRDGHLLRLRPGLFGRIAASGNASQASLPKRSSNA